MITSRRPTKYWSRLFAGLILSFEIVGRIADVVSVSTVAVETVRTAVGERYSLFSDASGRHPVWDCMTPIEIAVNLRQVSRSQWPALISDIQAAIDDISESSHFTLPRRRVRLVIVVNRDGDIGSAMEFSDEDGAPITTSTGQGPLASKLSESMRRLELI